MRIFFTGFFLIVTLFLKGQDAFFQWKQLHPEKWIANNDSISNAIPAPQIQLGNPLFSEVWAKNLMKKKKLERDLTVRFLVLSAGLSDFIQDSINNLEFRKKALELDSLPERHQLAIQGIEKMQLGIKELPKQWWPMLIEKELAVLEWEKHEELISQLGSLTEYSPQDLDSIWMVGMIRNYQESISLKNQLLPWNGGLIRSKQVFSLKASESSAMMGKNWRYFWGCDSSNKPFPAEKWKSLVAENQFKTVERERQKEELYFSDLQKNRENWEFLDKRENTLERMRAYVRQYDLVFFQEDSIRGIGIMRARSPQELIDLKRERERWRIGYYQKGMAQLAEIGQGIEGGPTVQDYSKQKGYFKLKDVQNVKKQAIGPLTTEIIQEEKETINPVKTLMLLQILDWNELPNSFKTLK
jgi:hypothetical protein